MALLPLVVALFLFFSTSCVTPVGDTARDPSRDTASPESPDFVDDNERENQEPLFAITGVLFHVSRLSPATAIILPPHSAIGDYMRNEPMALRSYPEAGLPADRFRLRLHLNTTEVPPFVLDRDRYLYPELYD